MFSVHRLFEGTDFIGEIEYYSLFLARGLNCYSVENDTQATIC